MRMATAGLGGLLLSGLWPQQAQARRKKKKASGIKSRVVEVKRGKLGTTITLELATAPFPWGSKPYKDATTLVYVPHHYRLPKNRKIDIIVHFHGHSTNVRQAIKDHMLREQLIESKQNAILVLPQGPLNSRDGNAGKFGDDKGFLRFLTDMRKTLQDRKVRKATGKANISHKGARIGRVALSAHSGGYHAAAKVLRHGGFEVKEVYLFDALYGDRAQFLRWVVETRKAKFKDRHKLICYYTGGKVGEQSHKLMKELGAQGVEVLHETKEGQLSRSELTTGNAIFIRTRVGHTNVTLQNNALRDCLFASGFKRRLHSKWFRDSDKPRKIDKRKDKRR